MLVPETAPTDPIEALFHAYYGAVTAIARRIVADRSDAEDVAQEVFAECLRLRDPSSPGLAGWLYATAARRALNFVRSRRRREARERVLAVLMRPLAAHPDPSSLLMRGERDAAVRTAMARLRPRDATLLALRYGADLPYRTIADLVGVPPAQVGPLLARAQRRFLKEMPNDPD